jgi:GT2 family glycosyltransferase
MTPRVTVIVPTRERRESLRACLRALARQTLGAALQIVVVHDGEDGGDLGADVVSFGAELITVPRAGPGAARNRGCAVASAPIVALTDDDCEPDARWAEELERALAGGADVAVGLTVNALARSRLSDASQLVVNHLTERSLDARIGYGAANNIGVRTDVLRAVPFDGFFRFAGGDRDWCARLRAAGKAFAYAPEAVVGHKHRLTPGAFVRQHVAYGRGAYRYRRRHGEPVRRESPLLYGSLIARGWHEGPAVGALVAVSQLSAAAGYVLAARPTLRSARRLRPPRLRRS